MHSVFTMKNFLFRFCVGETLLSWLISKSTLRSSMFCRVSHPARLSWFISELGRAAAWDLDLFKMWVTVYQRIKFVRHICVKLNTAHCAIAGSYQTVFPSYMIWSWGSPALRETSKSCISEYIWLNLSIGIIMMHVKSHLNNSWSAAMKPIFENLDTKELKGPAPRRVMSRGKNEQLQGWWFDSRRIIARLRRCCNCLKELV